MKKERKLPFVEIFADGACSGNPGVGGFGAILRSDAKEKELSDFESMTTNNRMELIGVITALEALKVSCKVNITTDSSYVVKGMTEWINDWIKRGWKNSQKKSVMNRDLWERLLKAAEPHDITWCWVKGHNGHAENERCDILALRAIKRYKQSSSFKKDCINRAPSPQPSPSGGEGYIFSPPLRGGDEGEGDSCGVINDRSSIRVDT